MVIAANPSRTAIRRVLVDFCLRRYAQTSELPLPEADQPAPRFMAVEGRLLLFCQRYRQQVMEVLAAELATEVVSEPVQSNGPLVQAMMSSTRRYIQRRNQFVALTLADHLRLTALYRRFIAGLLAALEDEPGQEHEPTPGEIGRRYGQALREHYGQLQRFFGALDERDMLQIQAVCAEYTPELQLALLGLAPEDLQEPILDVGCGAGAGLVRYLRSLGLDACGLDRDVSPGRHTVQGDWLTFDYGQRAWGTILSHMAFSTHFCFQHLNAQGQPQAYARALMAMLGALAPGGCLSYAPGLPFIEPLLAEQGYEMQCRALWDELPAAAQALGGYAPLLGGDPCYAATIWRTRGLD